MLFAAFMSVLVLFLCGAMYISTRLWFVDHFRRAHRLARVELRRFARSHRGRFRLGDEVPASGSAAVRIAGCACRASYSFRWVEARRGRRAMASKCLLVTKSIRADLRDRWTRRLDPLAFMEALKRYAGTEGPHADELIPTSEYEPPRETLVLASDALRHELQMNLHRRRRAFQVMATPDGLRFRAGPRMPLEELAETVAWYLELYGRAVDEANRPASKLYR